MTQQSKERMLVEAFEALPAERLDDYGDRVLTFRSRLNFY
jgi:hypothetical protein